MVATPDDPVHDLVWVDDHADRGAGPDHRVAARINSRIVPRQHRTFVGKDESAARAHPGAISEPDIPDPVYPDTISTEPVDPDSVKSGALDPCAGKAGPVFPGGSTTSYAESLALDPAVPDAIEAGFRPGGSSPGIGHDLRSTKVKKKQYPVLWLKAVKTVKIQ